MCRTPVCPVKHFSNIYGLLGDFSEEVVEAQTSGTLVRPFRAGCQFVKLACTHVSRQSVFAVCCQELVTDIFEISVHIKVADKIIVSCNWCNRLLLTIVGDVANQ